MHMYVLCRFSCLYALLFAHHHGVCVLYSQCHALPVPLSLGPILTTRSSGNTLAAPVAVTTSGTTINTGGLDASILVDSLDASANAANFTTPHRVRSGSASSVHSINNSSSAQQALHFPSSSSQGPPPPSGAALPPPNLALAEAAEALVAIRGAPDPLLPPCVPFISSEREADRRHRMRVLALQQQQVMMMQSSADAGSATAMTTPAGASGGVGEAEATAGASSARNARGAPSPTGASISAGASGGIAISSNSSSSGSGSGGIAAAEAEAGAASRISIGVDAPGDLTMPGTSPNSSGRRTMLRFMLLRYYLYL
jgi:hypothetical protein